MLVELRVARDPALKRRRRIFSILKLVDGKISMFDAWPTEDLRLMVFPEGKEVTAAAIAVAIPILLLPPQLTF